MKKITLLLFAFLAVSTITAQVPLTTAVDFTATDVEGHEHNLFQVLDSGQYVLIDFFFATCGPCQTIAPMVNEAYHYFGCNTADVVFWSIDTGDTDAECIAFDQTYGVEYPTISGVEGGGTAICNTYQVPMYPTVILIAPDHNIVEQDIWPISNAQSIINVLEGHGISQNSCSVGMNEIKDPHNDIIIYPNPANSLLNIDLISTNNVHKIEIINIIGKAVTTVDNIQGANNSIISVSTNNLQEGLYFVRVIFTDDQIITKKLNIIKE